MLLLLYNAAPKKKIHPAVHGAWIYNICFVTLLFKVLLINRAMTEQDEQIENLTEIRNLMERSTRFISLSGLSGISAGICALIGAAIAYRYENYSSACGNSLSNENKLRRLNCGMFKL